MSAVEMTPSVESALCRFAMATLPWTEEDSSRAFDVFTEEARRHGAPHDLSMLIAEIALDRLLQIIVELESANWRLPGGAA